jgi:hypothetical protein
MTREEKCEFFININRLTKKFHSTNQFGPIKTTKSNWPLNVLHLLGLIVFAFVESIFEWRMPDRATTGIKRRFVRRVATARRIRQQTNDHQFNGLLVLYRIAWNTLGRFVCDSPIVQRIAS